MLTFEFRIVFKCSNYIQMFEFILYMVFQELQWHAVGDIDFRFVDKAEDNSDKLQDIYLEFLSKYSIQISGNVTRFGQGLLEKVPNYEIIKDQETQVFCKESVWELFNIFRQSSKSWIESTRKVIQQEDIFKRKNLFNGNLTTRTKTRVCYLFYWHWWVCWLMVKLILKENVVQLYWLYRVWLPIIHRNWRSLLMLETIVIMKGNAKHQSQHMLVWNYIQEWDLKQ